MPIYTWASVATVYLVPLESVMEVVSAWAMVILRLVPSLVGMKVTASPALLRITTPLRPASRPEPGFPART